MGDSLARSSECEAGYGEPWWRDSAGGMVVDRVRTAVVDGDEDVASGDGGAVRVGFRSAAHLLRVEYRALKCGFESQVVTLRRALQMEYANYGPTIWQAANIELIRLFLQVEVSVNNVSCLKGRLVMWIVRVSFSTDK
jgi:hypothetical protein